MASRSVHQRVSDALSKLSASQTLLDDAEEAAQGEVERSRSVYQRAQATLQQIQASKERDRKKIVARRSKLCERFDISEEQARQDPDFDELLSDFREWTSLPTSDI